MAFLAVTSWGLAEVGCGQPPPESTRCPDLGAIIMTPEMGNAVECTAKAVADLYRVKGCSVQVKVTNESGTEEVLTLPITFDTSADEVCFRTAELINNMVCQAKELPPDTNLYGFHLTNTSLVDYVAQRGFVDNDSIRNTSLVTVCRSDDDTFCCNTFNFPDLDMGNYSTGYFQEVNCLDNTTQEDINGIVELCGDPNLVAAENQDCSPLETYSSYTDFLLSQRFNEQGDNIEAAQTFCEAQVMGTILSKPGITLSQVSQLALFDPFEGSYCTDSDGQSFYPDVTLLSNTVDCTTIEDLLTYSACNGNDYFSLRDQLIIEMAAKNGYYDADLKDKGNYAALSWVFFPPKAPEDYQSDLVCGIFAQYSTSFSPTVSCSPFAALLFNQGHTDLYQHEVLDQCAQNPFKTAEITQSVLDNL